MWFNQCCLLSRAFPFWRMLRFYAIRCFTFIQFVSHNTTSIFIRYIFDQQSLIVIMMMMIIVYVVTKASNKWQNKWKHRIINSMKMERESNDEMRPKKEFSRLKAPIGWRSHFLCSFLKFMESGLWAAHPFHLHFAWLRALQVAQPYNKRGTLWKYQYLFREIPLISISYLYVVVQNVRARAHPRVYV